MLYTTRNLCPLSGGQFDLRFFSYTASRLLDSFFITTCPTVNDLINCPIMAQREA